MDGSRGERLIEPSSSWFPPKFPWIARVEQFYQVKRMIRGIGDALSSTYSQTLNGKIHSGYLIELLG